MKKLWISILIVLTAIGFAGCIYNGQNKNDEKASAGQSSQIESDGGVDLDGDSTETEDSNENEDGSGTEDSGEKEDSATTENTPSNGTAVPPITDGGNFDGTV